MKRNSGTVSGCSGSDAGKQEIEQLFGRRELGHHVGMAERPPIPSEERVPAWRRACLAYDEWRQAGANEHEVHEAAVAAMQTVLPLPWQEASIEAENAVAYARRYHPEWVLAGRPAH